MFEIRLKIRHAFPISLPIKTSMAAYLSHLVERRAATSGGGGFTGLGGHNNAPIPAHSLVVFSS
jgi:hypothetical protein